MVITYALQYYDKGVFNQASLFGFLQDLDLQVLVKPGPKPTYSTLRYSQASMIFYCGYILGVYPATLLAQKYRTGRVCGILVTVWGICEICTVACHSFAGILIQRFFLGVLEAGIAPAFMVLCSQYYKRDELALRIGFWCSAQPLSNTFAPLISYGLGSINGSLAGYSIISQTC
jgi:MFS family permease